MKERNTLFMQRSLLSARVMVCRALICLSAAAAPLLAQSNTTMNHADLNHADHGSAPPELVQAVRDATKQFLDVNAAVSAGYQPVLGCVSGPDHGAMGVHYLKGSLLDGTVSASQPQALIYEPTQDGRMRLVGVEFIVDSAAWFASQKKMGVTNPGPPQLYEQLFQLIPSPNRFNLDTFFELHVWAWRDNPSGFFADWNNAVTCNHQGTTL
jgi:hypothetical protein